MSVWLPLQVAAMQVLPVFFKLFECQDKALRQLLFRHIIAGEPTPRPWACDSAKAGLLTCLPAGIVQVLCCAVLLHYVLASCVSMADAGVAASMRLLNGCKC